MIDLVPGAPVPRPAAWLGLSICGIAAVFGGLSLQAHGLAGNDLAGALGWSADEASLATTAGAMAEGAAVLAAAPLIGAFGVRRLLTFASCVTAAAAATALAFPDAAIWLRFLEAFGCGALPVAMMVWAMRAFPPQRRGLPLTLFAFASSIPGALAPGLAGVAALHWGGKGVYLADTLWSPGVALLAYVLLPREPAAPKRLASLDWLGYAILASGVMLAIAALSQGERRFWLETDWMATLIAGAIVALALAGARLLTARAPFFDLTLLSRPTFAIGMAEAFSLRFGLLMTSFAVPQALARLQGLRLEQAGEAVVWIAVGQAIGFPLAYFWLERRDGRWSLACGLALFALAALLSTTIDSRWSVEQFQAPLLVAGAGQGFFLSSVMTFATWNIPPPAGATAAGLFNLTRVMGTAGASAAVGYFLRVRENGHSARLVESLTSASDAANARLDELVRGYAPLATDVAARQGAATAALAGEASAQAYTLAFGDVFLGVAAILAAFALLVPLLPRIPAFREAPSHSGARS